MKINSFQAPLDSNKKLLCTTHTSRSINSKECDLNYLEKRYSNPKRLPPTGKFENLLPSTQYNSYSGTVAIWHFKDNNLQQPELLASIEFDDNSKKKPQHAIWYNGNLWILFTDSLLILSNTLQPIKEISHPWLSGAHTLVKGSQNCLLISCSASDSVLICEEKTGEIINVIRVPENIFGRNYSLTQSDSVTDHYIHNDIQLSHLNSACFWNNGILFTTLIQGIVGFFDFKGQYTEIIRGFVGAHGVRSNRDNIYFCDSCAGILVFLNRNGKITKRIECYSKWLHDAQHIKDDKYIISIADKNCLKIIDIKERKTISTIECEYLGNATQFLSWGN